MLHWGCRHGHSHGYGGGGYGGGFMGPPAVYEGDSTTIVNNYYVTENNGGDDGVYQVCFTCMHQYTPRAGIYYVQ